MGKAFRKKRKTRLRDNNTEAPIARAKQAATLTDVNAACMPYDETLLDRARTQWQFGDWENLAKLDFERVQHHPQRSKLALLAAAAHFQTGNINQAHRYLRLAEDWGCSQRLLLQMLVSGAHNSLGLARALLEQREMAQQHFRNAVNLGGIPGDSELLVQARAAWQITPSEDIGQGKDNVSINA